MADLFDRILGTPGDISVHQFEAALVDVMAGQSTRAQLIAAYSLDAEATTQLDSLLNKIAALTTKEAKVGFINEFNAILILSEEQLKYTTKAQFSTRLTAALNNWS